MKKIIINRCFGGFGLSYKAVMRYAELKGMTLYPWLDSLTRSIYKDQATLGNNEISHHYSHVPLDGLPVDKDGNPKLPNGADFYVDDIERDDPALIQTVDELGKAANGQCADLKIIKIPDDVQYTIERYDGNEHIAEQHRTWE